MYRFLLILCLCLYGPLSRAQQQQPCWKKVIPNRYTLQYAGSTGFLTVGAGYTLDKHHRATLDLMYGYVPEKFGGQVHAVTVKGMYDFLPVHIKGPWSISPLQGGVFVSYTDGCGF